MTSVATRPEAPADDELVYWRVGNRRKVPGKGDKNSHFPTVKV